MGWRERERKYINENTAKTVIKGRGGEGGGSHLSVPLGQNSA